MSPNHTYSDAAEYSAAISKRREARATDVGGPQGWLAAAALAPLATGTQTIGAAPECDIVVEGAPALLATVTVEPDGSVFLENGDEGDESGRSRLTSGASSGPAVSLSDSNFQIVSYRGIPHVRVKQAGHPARMRFRGLDFFPIEPTWRISAQWTKLDAPIQMPLANVWGGVEQITVTHTASFEAAGRKYVLYPTHQKGDQIVFIFGDGTTGRTSNRTGRFLFCDLPIDDEIILDFNMAINPPSAFTYFATCPIAPFANRLPLAINAGEKAYLDPISLEIPNVGH